MYDNEIKLSINQNEPERTGVFFPPDPRFDYPNTPPPTPRAGCVMEFVR